MIYIGVDPVAFTIGSFSMRPLGFIGAKLVHVVDNMSHYLAYPADILNPAGFAIFGAILGGMLGVCGVIAGGSTFRSLRSLTCPPR